MNQFSILSICFFISLFASTQHELKDIDTTLNYKKVFYRNDSLILHPYYKYYDSITYRTYIVTKEKFEENIGNLDTSKIQLLREFTWKNEYKKKNKSYYYLAYYKDDILKGKRYDFNSKDRLISTFKNYPKIKDSIFNGSQIINYDKKGRITSVKYIQFNKDQTFLFYWNYLSYNKSGVLTSYSYVDEEKNKTRFITYSKNGEIIKDYKRDETEWYNKKWNKKKTKLKEEVHLKNQRLIRIYRNNILIKEKTK